MTRHARHSRMRSLILWVTAILIVGVLGCVWRKVPQEYRAFFRLPPDEQVTELQKMAIERQLDVYIVGVTRIHPPRSDLGLAIGRQGPEILPALLDRLRRERHGYEKASLVFIMVGMPCTADVLARVHQGIESARLEVVGIEDSAHRSRAERNLNRAENRCRADALSQPRDPDSRVLADIN